MSERLTPKVLLLGWDAADWIILKDLMARGLMPAFSKFVETGVSGKIASLRPILSPMLWNSVATGKMPDKHGIFDFVEPRPDASGIRPVSSTSRTCKAVWNILSQKGMSSNVVNWFASFPAEPIKGTVITDRYGLQCTIKPDARAATEGMFHPPRLAEGLMPMVVDPAHLGEAIRSFVPRADEIDQKKDERLQKLAKLLAKTSTVQAAAVRLMLSEPWDFMAVYFDAIDHFGHTFMPYHPPAMEGIDPHDAELYGECITGIYRFHDMMLSTMWQAVGEDTTIILVSDHGFHSQGLRPGTDGYHDPVAWHRPFGVIAANGPGIKRGQEVYGSTLLDLTPTILTMLGLPVGADMDGRPLVEMFDRPVQPETIITWEAFDEGDPGLHPEDTREDPALAVESIRQLVDLGYMEAPSDDQQLAVDRTLRSQKQHLATSLTYGPRIEAAVPLWEELIEAARSADETDQMHQHQMQLAFCFASLQRHEDCQATLDALPEALRSTPAGQMMLAQICLSQGKAEEALARLDQAGAAGDSAQALATVGSANLQLGRLEQADSAFRKALDIDEERAGAWQGLAQIALRRKDYPRTIECALRAVGLVHGLPAAHYCLGHALSRIGRVDEAILALETAIGLQPKMRRAHRLLGLLYREAGHGEDLAWKHELAARASSDGEGLVIDP